jgi:hypothetical protein
MSRTNGGLTMQRVADWLKKLDMSEYAERFVENDIDESVLVHLTDHDLKELGVSLGHRRKMLAAIAALTGDAVSNSPQPVLQAKGGPAEEPAQARREAPSERPHVARITSAAFELISNPILFFVLYIFFVVPTYILPYFGSNSLIIGAALTSAMGSNPFFWIHVLCFACLVVITWWRGYASNSSWIAVFPVIGGIFDLVPGFSWFALLPTLMHVLALVFGVKEKVAPDPAIATGFGVRFLAGLVVIVMAVFAVGLSFAIVNSASSNRLTQSQLPGITKNTTARSDAIAPLREPLPPDLPVQPDVLRLVETDPFFSNAPAVFVGEYRVSPIDNQNDYETVTVQGLRPGLVRETYRSLNFTSLMAANGLIILSRKFPPKPKAAASTTTFRLLRIDNMRGRIFPVAVGNKFSYDSVFEYQDLGASGNYDFGGRWEIPASSWTEKDRTSCEVIKADHASAFHTKLTGMAYLLQCDDLRTRGDLEPITQQNRTLFFDALAQLESRQLD